MSYFCDSLNLFTTVILIEYYNTPFISRTRVLEGR